MSNIRVAVRVRPLSDREKEKGSREIIEIDKNTISIENVKVLGMHDFGDSRSKFKAFSYDHIYNCLSSGPAYATQKQVFEDLGSQVLTSALDGFNACVFAYGQTGTGKTHTMMGYPGDAGLIPRICEGLFHSISECTDDNVTCRVDVSYFEIYKEKVHDLLQQDLPKQGAEKVSLRVREHPKDGPYVHGLSWHRVREYVEVQELLDRGTAQRVTAETYIHDRSSRSHAIVTISFTQARLEENRPSEIVSKMHLVDLAGSEKADPSSRPDFRKRLTEGSSINRSLVALGNVIKALAEKSLLSWSSDDMGSTHSFSGSGGGESPAGVGSPGSSGKRAPFIPYRDSPLTYLLKDSLGGNSKTIMIATITPASHFYSETLSTLRYAQRAKNIINKPRINEDTNVALIRELRKEIEKLREMLANAQKPGSPCEDIMYFVPSYGRHRPSDQGGDFVNLQDSDDTIIAEKLHENEEMAKQLTRSWMGKWSSTHDIMKETDLSIRNLRNRHNSMGVMIDSQLPYLVGMDDDVLSTGVVIFHLKEGDTTVGREDAEIHQDIVLMGPFIQQEHCVIHHGNGEVRVHPLPGAMCSIQGIECTEPTRLAQGDYVAFGGDQVFRFNNPAEAAKLRENRRSQGSLNTLNTSHMSFGGLSRASSYSSLGTDDSNFLSPNSQLGRSYPNRRRHSDIVIHELERKHNSEHERIAEARRKLDELHEEHERAEESRLEKEEEMYARHEQHRLDIEEQKRHLARLVQENERARQKAEEELQLSRDSLGKEKEAFQKELDEQRKKLKQGQSSKQNTQSSSSGIQTDPLSLKTSSTDALETVAMETETDNDNCTDKSEQPAKKVRKLSVDDQLRELEATEFSRRMSYRETEESLSIQQEDMEDQYEATRERIEAKMAKIRQIEEQYRDMDKEYLEQMSKQTAVVDALHKEEVQLEVYIQENEELMSVSRDVPRPLRGACSEMFLTDPALNTATFPQKTSSLRDVHNAEDENQLNAPQINVLSASADSVKSESATMATNSRTQKADASKAKKDASKKDPLAITNVAKDVTSRLYKPPAPKFKYVPKSKEEAPPSNRPARVRATDAKSKSSPSKFFQEHSPSPQRSEHSPSPMRQGGKRSSPSPSRDLDPKRGASPGPTKPFLKKGTGKPLETKATGKVMSVRNKSDTNKKDTTKTRAASPKSTQDGRESPDSGSLSPGSTASRTPPVKLRHIASASSLASVPESTSEESEAQNQEPVSYVVKRRAKKGRSNQFDDEFRTHSAPDSQNMEKALDEYTLQMMGGLAPEKQDSDRVVPPYNTSYSVDDADLQRGDSTDNNDQTEESSAAGETSAVLGKRDHSDLPADSYQSPPVSPRKRSKSEGADSSDSDWCEDDNTRTCVPMDAQSAPKERSFSDDSLNASDVSEDSLESDDKRRLTQSLPAYLMRDEKPISDDSLNDSLEDKKEAIKEDNTEVGQLDMNNDQSADESKSETVNPEPKKLSSLEEKMEKAKAFTMTEVEYCDVATLGPEPKSKPSLSMVALPPIDICDGSPINAETMTEPGPNCEDLQVQTIDTDSSNNVGEPIAQKSAPAPHLSVVNLPNVFFISNTDNSSSDDGKAKVEETTKEDVPVNKDEVKKYVEEIVDGAKVKKYVEEIVDGAKEKIIEETQQKPERAIEVAETPSNDDKQTPSIDNNSNTGAINDALPVGEIVLETEMEVCSEANKTEAKPDNVVSGIEASKNTSGTNSGDESEITKKDKTQVDESNTKDKEQHENIDVTFKPIKASESEQMEVDVANNEDPDETAPEGAVSSGSALSATEKSEADQQNGKEHEQQQQEAMNGEAVDELANAEKSIDDAANTKSRSSTNQNLPGDMETQPNQTETGQDQDTATAAKDIAGETASAGNSIVDAANAKSNTSNKNLPGKTETQPNQSQTGQDHDTATASTTAATASAKDTADETGVPLTRSIGVGTSLECLTMEDGEAMMLGSDDDSYVDPETELQVLQDALDQLPARPSATGPQLSTARRAARQRAMIRQQQRQQRTGDSEGPEPGSDESPNSGNRSKSSSRPGSGSRRRKRPQGKAGDKSKQRTDHHTSDDYDSSENDSVYSDGSVEDKQFSSKAGRCQAGRNVANGGQDIVITTDSVESSDAEEMSRLFKNHLRKPSARNRQRLESTEFEDGPDGKRNVGIQTPVYGRFSTRPELLSNFDGSFTSEDLNRNMTVSPISVWASDKPKKGKKSARNSSSSSGVVKSGNEGELSQSATPRSSTRSTSSVFLENSNLQQGVTEVWSSSTSELRPLQGFNDDLSYSVETESIIPLASSLDYSEDGLPSGSFVESRSDMARPGCSTPKISGRAVSISYPESQVEKAANLDYATPVKFEVTVHEETPNIIYNVEKTEYKTYALRNGDQEKPQVIPDTIHVNMTENLSSQTEEKLVSHTTENVKFERPDLADNSDGEVFESERAARSKYSSERETGTENGQIKSDKTKEDKEMVEDHTQYKVPSDSKQETSPKVKRVQLRSSGLVEATNYPGNRSDSPQNELKVSSELNYMDESDYTSDYGTFISFDGRRCSESEEDSISPRISPRPSQSVEENVQQSRNVPALQAAIAPIVPLETSLDNAEQLEDSSSTQPGQQICSTEEVVTPLVIAARTEQSSPVQFILNTALEASTTSASTTDTESGSCNTVRPQQETLDDLDSDIPEQTNAGTQVDTKHLQSPRCDKSASSAEEMFISLEQTESNSSSCSSEYKTPKQSPRDIDNNETSEQVANVVIPDLEGDTSFTMTPRVEEEMSAQQGPMLTSSPKVQPSVKNASVNTELNSAASKISPRSARVREVFGGPHDPIHTEATRREMEAKIARLKHNVRSLSDSAISSDYTDCDSSSPRGNRVCDADRKTTDKKLSKTKVQHPGAAGDNNTDPRRTLNFESEGVKKSPFKDSGSILDEATSDEEGKEDDTKPTEVTDLKNTHELLLRRSKAMFQFEPAVRSIGKFPETIVGAVLAIKPYPLQRSASLDSIATLVNTGTSVSRAARESQSIEDLHAIPDTNKKDIPTESKQIQSSNFDEVDENENLLSSGGLGSQYADRPLSPGEIGIGQGSIDDMVEAVENENIKPNTCLPVAAANSQIVSEKATSMSFLDERPMPEYHRSLSEGNIDDLDGTNDTSCTSNDSITFVFVGQEYAKHNSNEYQDDETGANNAPKHANISGRGPIEISSSDSENVSVVLSRSASFESVLMEDKTEDQISTHSASEEIEEIIKATNQPTNLQSQRVIDDRSPPTYTDTSDGPVPNRNYGYDDDDSAPLRHRFGIDESVLPIPERSVSADNIPKQVLQLKDMNRSRSTSMLDMAAAETEESESGIFPPALSYVDEDQTDPSMSLRTMSEGALEQFSQRSLSERGATNSDQASSELHSSEMEDFSSAGIQSVSNSSSMGEIVEEYSINYTSNNPKYKHVVIGNSEDDDDKLVKEEEDHIREVLRTVERFFMPTICSSDKGTSTDPEDVRVTDVPEDSSPTSDSGTQTAANMQTMVQPSQIRLPALASAFRAQSVESFGLGRHADDIELSEGAENWCTLGELMIETTQLLRTINEKLPDLDRRESVSSAESQAILKQWQNISIQTGSSLDDLQTVGLQTDEPTKINTNETTRATQVEPEFRLNQLEISEICTEEMLTLPISTNQNVAQLDDSASDIPVVEESLAASQQSKQFAALPAQNNTSTNSSKPNKNTTDTGIDTHNKPENKNAASQQPKANAQTARFIPQVKAELGLDKEGQQNETESELPQISPRSQRTALTMPNTPEMEDLRKEHNKLMENLRKASDNRKARKDAVKSRKHVPQELDLSNKNSSAPNSLDNSIDSEMQRGAPNVSDSSDRNEPDTRSSVGSSLASPQEFVKINIQMNPDEGVTIENTVFQERKRKEPNDKQQPDETETHSWQLLKDEPQKSAAGEGRLRASSGSSVSSSDTCVSAEVANVMSTPPSRSRQAPGEREGALNPVYLDESTETEDVDEAGSSVSNNESEVEDGIVPRSHSTKEVAPSFKKKPEQINVEKKEPAFIKCETSPKVKSSKQYPQTSQSPDLVELDKPVNENKQPGQKEVANEPESLRKDLLPRQTLNKNIVPNEDLVIPETRTRDHAVPHVSNRKDKPKESQKQEPSSSDNESVIEDLVEPETHNRNHSLPPQQKRQDLPNSTDDGTQASVAISDDSTQTDPDSSLESIIYPTKVSSEYMIPMLKSPTQKQPAENKTPERLKNELEKLHGQRQHMMEMLGMSHMPPSLTVELLEAKLNYCIGQTDLLLDNLEDNVRRDPQNSSSNSPERQKAIDFIERYRADLKKSKEDIDECRERLNHRTEVGIGRGRTPYRRSDRQRQAQLDAFRLERMREQQDYDRTKRAPNRGSTPYQGNTPLRGNTPMMGNSPVVTPRSERSRSSSPTYSPGYMTPREHKAHLVDLRRQLITDVMEEEIRTSSEPPPPLHSTPPRRNIKPRDGSLGFLPRTSTSSYESPPHHRSPPTYNAYTAPPERSPTSSPHRLPFNRYTSPGQSRYPDTFDTKTTAESIFSPQETAAILQEIDDNKKKLPGMSTPMEEMYRRSSFSSTSSQRSDSSSRRDPFLSPRSHSDSRSSRKSTSPVARQPDYSQPLSLNLDGLNDDEQPYSPYSAYARERVLPRERSPVGAGGVVRGTFELYHSRSNSQSDSSSVLSFGSDLDSSNQRPRLNSLDEDTVKRLRPVCAEDIKARLGRHKR